MRLVLDTDVVVAAVRSPGGASAELLRRIGRGQATMLLSVALVLEYESICLRAEHRIVNGLSEAEVVLYVEGLVKLSAPVEPHFRWRPQLRDPADEMVLEVAINGQADSIVTFNVRDFGDGPGRFGIDVLRPADALRRLKI
jgi:putative PIN family toxin of toxin-antitoxin system